MEMIPDVYHDTAISTFRSNSPLPAFVCFRDTPLGAGRKALSAFVEIDTGVSSLVVFGAAAVDTSDLIGFPVCALLILSLCDDKKRKIPLLGECV